MPSTINQVHKPEADGHHRESPLPPPPGAPSSTLQCILEQVGTITVSVRIIFMIRSGITEAFIHKESDFPFIKSTSQTPGTQPPRQSGDDITLQTTGTESTRQSEHDRIQGQLSKKKKKSLTTQ